MDDIDDERSSSVPPTSPRDDYEGDRAILNHQTQSVSTPESRSTPSPQRYEFNPIKSKFLINFNSPKADSNQLKVPIVRGQTHPLKLVTRRLNKRPKMHQSPVS